VLAGQSAEELVLIDIRTPAEWADTGVATGAVRLDMTSADFVSGVSKVISENPGKKLAFICRSGNRSNALTSQMEASGITNTINVIGGTSQWIADGLPITKP
jgi:rhodanese-related sulfurtransferase